MKHKNLQPVWLSPQQIELPISLRSWMLHKGSFMKHLETCAIHPEVKVLQQEWQIPLDSEREVLELEINTTALIREVFIMSGNAIWMFARSVFPREILVGQYQELAHLKNRSLGSVLFNDPSIARGEFELACLDSTMPWYNEISKQVDFKADKLWARRSLFTLSEKKLLLTEVFLPSIMELEENDVSRS